MCCPAWQLVDCVCVSKCVCHLSNKELLYCSSGSGSGSDSNSDDESSMKIVVVIVIVCML